MSIGSEGLTCSNYGTPIPLDTRPPEHSFPWNTHPPGTPIPQEVPSLWNTHPPWNSHPPGTPIPREVPSLWNTHPPWNSHPPGTHIAPPLNTHPPSHFDLMYSLGLPSQHELPRFIEK